MATTAPKIADEDVFALTETGKAQLEDAQSTLSRQALELLVLIDGNVNAAKVVRLAPGMKPAEAQDWLLALLGGGFIRPARPHEGLDVLEFSGDPDTSIAFLKRLGYYVRIARPPQAPRPKRPGAKRAALVVDDDVDICALLTKYLVLEGFEVITAGNRDAIVTALRRPTPVDLVLLDVKLPDADGFSVLERMRAHPVLKDVPVIMLTASATRAAVLKGLQLGADGYVTKPFQLDPLMKAVHTVLGLAEPEAAQPGPWGRGKPGVSSRAA